MIKIYTDGSCRKPHEEGGWSYVILRDDKLIHENSGYEKHTTSQETEVQAICNAILYASQHVPITEEIILYSDSTYAVKGSSSWRLKWRDRDWLNAKGKTVAHVEYWKCINSNIRDLKITFKHIKGHQDPKSNGHAFWNHKADALARATWKSKSN